MGESFSPEEDELLFLQNSVCSGCYNPSTDGVRQTQTADWQVNEVNIVVECSNWFPIPKLEF